MNYTNQVTLAILLSFLVFTISGKDARERVGKRITGVVNVR